MGLMVMLPIFYLMNL